MKFSGSSKEDLTNYVNSTKLPDLVSWDLGRYNGTYGGSGNSTNDYIKEAQKLGVDINKVYLVQPAK